MDTELVVGALASLHPRPMSGDAGAEVTQVAHLISPLRIRFAMIQFSLFLRC